MVHGKQLQFKPILIYDNWLTWASLAIWASWTNGACEASWSTFTRWAALSRCQRVGRLLIRRLGSHSMARLGRRRASDDPGCPGFSPHGLTSCQMAQVRLLRRDIKELLSCCSCLSGRAPVQQLLLLPWAVFARHVQCFTVWPALHVQSLNGCSPRNEASTWAIRISTVSTLVHLFPQTPQLCPLLTLYTSGGPGAANSHAHVHNRPKPQRVFSFLAFTHHLDYLGFVINKQSLI